MGTKTIAMVLAATLASWSAAAAASEPYPAAIKSDLHLSYTPRCDLCHEHASAPVGEASQPFAKSLEERGLEGHDDLASLKVALERDKGVDSDGDGAEDLDELSWGGNPNVSDAPKDKPPPEVSYGCGGGTQGSASFGAVTALVGLALSTRRRRPTSRRRRRER